MSCHVLGNRKLKLTEYKKTEHWSQIRLRVLPHFSKHSRQAADQMGHKDKYKSFRKVTGCDLLWHQRRKKKTHGGIYINSLSSTSPVSFFHHSCGQSGWKEDNTMMEIRWRRWGSAGVGGVRGGEWFAATARGSYRVCRMSCGHKQPHTHCRSTTATALAHGHRPEPHPHGG